MRVSTQQFYFQSTNRITDKQSDVNIQSTYLASGKRVLSAKDDAINYGTLTGYKNELVKLDQYQRNITQAQNRNELTETSLSLAESTMLQVKQVLVQANNGALSDDDRVSLAEQLQQHMEQLLDIANSKDETGSYIFAGFQTDKQPFTIAPDNTVTYQGDHGVKELSISNSVTVPLNQPGDDAFMKVPNVIGDFLPSYQINTGEATVKRAAIIDRGTYDAATFPPGYTLDFTDADSNGSLEVVVTDSTSGNVTTIDPFVPDQPFTFNGVEVTIEGDPQIGDQIVLQPQEQVSVFDTLQSAINWVKTTGSAANTAQHQIDYGHILSQFNEAQGYISSRQAQAGITMQLIERQDSNHADTRLHLDQGRSSIEDLDFASAVSQFEQSKVALQAAQQTFTQMQQLSLFNFI